MTDQRVIEATSRFMRTARSLPTLFDLDEQLLAILALIEDAESNGQEVTDGLEARREEVEAALAQKVEGYCSVIRSLERMRDARKAEADRLRDRAATSAAAADWLKARLKLYLESTGQQRVETARFSISLAKSPPRVDVLEEMMVPSEFKKTVITTSVDKRAIMDHVKTTGEIPSGVEVVHGVHVRIS